MVKFVSQLLCQYWKNVAWHLQNAVAVVFFSERIVAHGPLGFRVDPVLEAESHKSCLLCKKVAESL